VKKTSEPLSVRVKRVYLPPSPGDGVRVLVDRLWPRGLSKSEAAIGQWMEDLAPSTELRRWFGHNPTKLRSSDAHLVSGWWFLKLARGLRACVRIRMQLHKCRCCLGGAALGLGRLGCRGDPQQQAHHQALPEKS
jgi:Inactive DUF488-N3 subclade